MIQLANQIKINQPLYEICYKNKSIAFFYSKSIHNTQWLSDLVIAFCLKLDKKVIDKNS